MLSASCEEDPPIVALPCKRMSLKAQGFTVCFVTASRLLWGGRAALVVSVSFFLGGGSDWLPILALLGEYRVHTLCKGE